MVEKGIVLTPPHIVKLMIHLLDIKPTDNFIDLCSGTGSFAMEAHRQGCKNSLSVEISQKMYSIL